SVMAPTIFRPVFIASTVSLPKAVRPTTLRVENEPLMDSTSLASLDRSTSCTARWRSFAPLTDSLNGSLVPLKDILDLSLSNMVIVSAAESRNLELSNRSRKTRSSILDMCHLQRLVFDSILTLSSYLPQEVTLKLFEDWDERGVDVIHALNVPTGASTVTILDDDGDVDTFVDVSVPELDLGAASGCRDRVVPALRGTTGPLWCLVCNVQDDHLAVLVEDRHVVASRDLIDRVLKLVRRSEQLHLERHCYLVVGCTPAHGRVGCISQSGGAGGIPALAHSLFRTTLGCLRCSLVSRDPSTSCGADDFTITIVSADSKLK